MSTPRQKKRQVPADMDRQPAAQSSAELGVRELNARLHDLERLVSDLIWECNQELTLTYASPRSTQLLGRHPLALQGQSLLKIGEFCTDFNSQRHCQPPQEIARRIPFRDVPYTAWHHDGMPRMLLLSGLPVFHDTTQVFLGYRGTARDVTAQVEAQHQEAKARRQLIEAIEAIDDGFALFNADETLVFANSRMRELSPGCSDLLARLGTTLTEITHACAETDLAGADQAEIDRQVAERLHNIRHGQASNDRVADGRWLRVSKKYTPAGDLVSIRTDITDLIERETAILATKEEAELANRTKTEFFANMSHELRTPLNAIIGFCEVMRDELFGKIGNDRYKEYVSDILVSGRHLLSIINDILDVSKAEAGKLELREETLQVGDLIDSAIRLVGERVAQGKIELRRELAPDLPALFADGRKIKQILLNLLSNAAKFTPPDGTITIAAEVSQQGELVITTTDTGIGMTEEQIEIALTPFGQVDSAFCRGHQGTGLGLPLCISLTQLHNGSLTVESQPDIGTTVRITLPSQRLRFS